MDTGRDSRPFVSPFSFFVSLMASDEYSSAVEWLFSQHHALGIQLGLDRMKEACRALHHPEEAFRCVHVAGTNGKGSVCTKIAKAFELSGFPTGLYTSPHISSFRERIQVNGVCISEEEVCDGVATIRRLCSDRLTFFEITTLLAFLWFRKKGVQRAVLETGLGGRLDATNVCFPDVSIITSISFDHMNYLGNTLESIAFEKAGIIKEKIPVVIGPRVPYEVIARQAEKMHSPLFQVEGEWVDFDVENSVVARKALSLLDMPLQIIMESIRFRPPCRFQEVHQAFIHKSFRKAPEAVILDVAHNLDGIERLLMKAKIRFPHSRFCVLFAVSYDKDVQGMVSKLCREAAAIICTEAPSERAMDSHTLAESVRATDPFVPVIEEASPREALAQAIEFAASEQSPLLITGTFFFMSAIRSGLGFDDEADLFDLNPVFETGVPAYLG